MGVKVVYSNDELMSKSILLAVDERAAVFGGDKHRWDWEEEIINMHGQNCANEWHTWHE